MARTEKEEVALLKILIAAGERGIDAFQASANIKDEQLLADLESVIERSRAELAALTDNANPA
jgi:hypothetical protein